MRKDSSMNFFEIVVFYAYGLLVRKLVRKLRLPEIFWLLIADIVLDSYVLYVIYSKILSYS